MEENRKVSDRKLPEDFLKEMEGLFGKLPENSPEELPAFLDSLQEERSYGLRRNPLKYTKEEFEAGMPFSLEPVPWAAEGYFYSPEEQPGKSPFHEAGAYYMQEPSAMIVVEVLAPKPGERIADLCAAPGGKSSQIAGRMAGEGLLVCNEYVESRAAVLAQNMERMGVPNCVILKEDTEKLSKRFPLFFDRILVDAPCSGEGMFRKEGQALSMWSPENVERCSRRQMEILENAAVMVRPGGVLVYSTCTFSEKENEAVIEAFLKTHPEYRADETILTERMKAAGVCSGKLPGTIRMFPHRLNGEGHFAARLIKAGELPEKKTFREKDVRKGKHKILPSEEEKLFLQFYPAVIEFSYLERLADWGRLVWKKERLYCIPHELPSLDGLKAERTGLFLGEAKKGRFEPSHTWAMTLKKDEVKQWVETKNPEGYLRGESEACREEDNGEEAKKKGWCLVLFQNRPLGWGKCSGGILKNHYPKGLRKF